MAARKLSYRASSNLTTTNLQSLAASQTFVAGWTSAWYDNTTNLDLDVLLSGKFVMAASNNQAGEVRVYVYAMLDDSNGHGIFSAGTEGTEGTATVVDTEQRDSGLILLWSTVTDSSASDVHAMPKRSVAAAFGGTLPPKFAVFVTGNGTTTTTAQFASSGNQITSVGVQEAIA